MLSNIEEIRRDVSSALDKEKQSRLGQFFTPQPIARFMASLFDMSGKERLTLLDTGAGVGSLSATFLEAALKQDVKQLEVTAYEVDKELEVVLREGLKSCEDCFQKAGKDLKIDVVNRDFIEHAVIGLCTGTHTIFDCAILNPPYHKINSNSTHRKLLRKVRIETVNLYSAFVALSLKLLADGGQMVAIIPRSFCNGPYYKPFRELVLSLSAIRHIHLFEARDKAFGEDEVLQENIILHLSKGIKQGAVTISTSADGAFSDYQERTVPFTDIIKQDDPEYFLHIPHMEGDSELNGSPAICFSLVELGCEVSTGPVVDFRVKEYLRKMPEENTAPLIYPAHFNGWTINHPIEGFKKNNAIAVNDQTTGQLYPAGYYTVVRRFSSKEEKRRIVARVIRPEDIRGELVGFENHLNVFHSGKRGLLEEMAFGLAVYLNSAAVDEYFRLFSGHTQVNATDLRLIKYPCSENLVKLGIWGKRQKEYDQSKIDDQVAKLL